MSNSLLTKKNLVPLIFLLPLWIFAQRGLPYQQFSVEDGLPSDEIYWASQDAKGDMWICSDHGLVAYDGLFMRSFSTENRLPDNTVFKCFPDSKGRLWFTTQSKGIFWMRNDTIHIPNFNKDLKSRLKNKWLDKIYVDEKDHVWMSSFNSDTVFYEAHIDTNRITPIPIPLGNLCKDVVYFVKKDGKCVLSGTSDAMFNDQDKNCLGDTAISARVGDFEILVKTRESNSEFTMNDGLSKPSFSHLRTYFSNGKNGLEWFSIRDKLFHIDSLGKIRLVHEYDNQVLDIFQEKNRLIVSIGEGGILVYEANGFKLKKKGNYFQGLNVSHTNKDRSGNYWISIVSNGLFKVPSFDVLALSIDPKYTSLKNISKPWLFRNDSLLFLAKDSLYIFQKKEDRFKLLSIQNLSDKRKLNSPARITWDIKNSLYGEGWSWDFKKQEFTEYFSNTGTTAKWFLEGEKKRVVYDLSNGYLIYEEGQVIFDSRDFNFSKRIRSIYLIDSNHHFVGSLGSLYEFKNGKYTDLGELDKRLNLRVEEIKRHENGDLWLATRGSGIGLLNEDSVYFISKENGLSSNLVNKIFLFQNTVFVATNKGLDKISKDENGQYFVNSVFSRRRGSFALIDNVFETKGGIIVQNGFEMTFLGNEYLENEVYKPKVIFNLFSVSGNPEFLDSNKLYELEATEKNIRISFRINGLRNENNPTLFQYRLLGSTHEWQSTFNQEVLFNSLESGDYVFEIRAREANNDWSNISRISFSIDKPFYLKIWFIAATILLIGGIFFYYWRFRTLDEARSKELISSNIKALKNQMSPHFIFNSLNSIQYFIATNQKREANIFLSKLSDLVRNVLNTTNESSISLEEDMHRIEDYVQLEQMRLANSFIFKLKNEENLNLEKYQIPPMLLQPLIENAIWHGLSEIEKDGEILLNLKTDGTDVLISIIDNGHGMDIEKWENDPSNSGKGNSIGLFNVKQRMKLLSKIKGKDYSIKFKNLEQNPRRGTEVILKIPQ